jgi:hypothetical protein
MNKKKNKNKKKYDYYRYLINKEKILKKTKQYYKVNRKKLLQKYKKYYERNKGKLLKYSKKYNRLHKEKIKSYLKKNRKQFKRYAHSYYIKYKDKILKQQKEWYQKNKNIILKQAKQYRKTHQREYVIYRKSHKKEIAKRMRIYGKKYWKKRYNTDINYKLVRILRRRINHIIKNNPKFSTTMKLIGCSIEQLKYYLESLFKLGMSWDNYGNGWNGKGMQEWHVDHKIPCASFDLSKPSEQKKCFHYTNLQPLWAEENLSKGKKYDK